MAEWQPIETAPKNGEDIILAAFKETPHESICMWAEDSFWSDGRWSLTSERERANERYPATHWLLLPVDPK